MVNASNSYLPKSVYTSNKDGIRVARPDIIVPVPNNATSFFSINRSIAQINSREILFLARHDTIDSPLISSPRFLKDTGAKLEIPDHLNVDQIILKARDSSIDVYDFYPQIVENRDGTGLVTSIEISVTNIPEGFSLQVEFIDPTSVVS